MLNDSADNHSGVTSRDGPVVAEPVGTVCRQWSFLSFTSFLRSRLPSVSPATDAGQRAFRSVQYQALTTPSPSGSLQAPSPLPSQAV